MITMQTDIRMSMEEMRVAFQRMLADKNDEFERIIQEAIESFDFETVLKEHIHEQIYNSIEDTFSNMDLKPRVELLIWDELDKLLERNDA